MKYISIKICLVIATLFGGVAVAAGGGVTADASELPDCTEIFWHNCFGTFTWSSDSKYVGEWKDGKRTGQGIYTWPSGAKYVGEWKDNLTNGQGSFTSSDGTVSEGIWKDSEFLGTIAEWEIAEKKRITKEKQEQEELVRRENVVLAESFLDKDNKVKDEFVDAFWQKYGFNDIAPASRIIVSPNRRYYLTGSCQAYLVDIEQLTRTYLGSPNGYECHIFVGFSDDSTKAYFYGENWLNVKFYYTDGTLIGSYIVATNPYIESVEFSENSESAEIHTSRDGIVIVEFK
jgi:hypothetical protein